MYLNMSYVLNVFYVKIYLKCQDKAYILRTNYLLMFQEVKFAGQMIWWNYVEFQVKSMIKF